MVKMIPNYPYFGLPNYMRYVNPQIHANLNQPYNKYNYYASNPTYSSHINRTDNTTSKHKIYTGSNKPSEQNIYAGTKFTSNPNGKTKENSYKNTNFSQDTAPLFSLFGLNLYFDDVLLICIIFFLYNENVNDPFLFITLILLLLN